MSTTPKKWVGASIPWSFCNILHASRYSKFVACHFCLLWHLKKLCIHLKQNLEYQKAVLQVSWAYSKFVATSPSNSQNGCLLDHSFCLSKSCKQVMSFLISGIGCRIRLVSADIEPKWVSKINLEYAAQTMQKNRIAVNIK